MKLLLNYIKDLLEVIYAFGEHRIKFQRIRKYVSRVIITVFITLLIALRIILLIFQQLTTGFDKLAYLIQATIIVLLVIIIYKTLIKWVLMRFNNNINFRYMIEQQLEHFCRGNKFVIQGYSPIVLFSFNDRFLNIKFRLDGHQISKKFSKLDDQLNEMLNMQLDTLEVKNGYVEYKYLRDENKLKTIFKKVFPDTNFELEVEEGNIICMKSDLLLKEIEKEKERIEAELNENVEIEQDPENKKLIRILVLEKFKDEKIPWKDEYLKEDGIFSIGIDMKKEPIIIDFNKFSNMLIGGEPGGGKTKLMQLIAYQCLMNKAITYIGDFKGIDFIQFKNKCEVITEHNKLLKVLKDFKRELERRKKKFIEVAAENLKDYNKITNENMKRQYLIIDELGEAMEIVDPDLDEKETKILRSEIEKYLKSIARLGRAFGLNLIVGTQRPDVSILEGQTRDQFSGRVCFKCVEATSKIVLGNIKASLLGDEPGRAIIKQRTNFIETQVYLFEKYMIKNIDNKKHLKVVGKDENIINENTLNKKNSDIIDYDLD